jgi:hypothetical protein
MLMPTVTGQLLADAIALLQSSGVLVPASIGYFGTYPISAKWNRATIKNGAISPIPGIVTAQSISAGTNVSANTPVILTVNEYPIAVVFP